MARRGTFEHHDHCIDNIQARELGKSTQGVTSADAHRGKEERQVPHRGQGTGREPEGNPVCGVPATK